MKIVLLITSFLFIWENNKNEHASDQKQLSSITVASILLKNLHRTAFLFQYVDKSVKVIPLKGVFL
jgi:hypothetical protein